MAGITILRIILGAILLAAGLFKIKDLKMFAAVVRTFNLLPRILIKPLSYSLVLAEIIFGGLLLIGYQTYYISILVAMMQFVSMVFVSIALIRHKKLKDCGCFGALIKVPITWWHVLVNAVFIALALKIFFSV